RSVEADDARVSEALRGPEDGVGHKSQYQGPLSMGAALLFGPQRLSIPAPHALQYNISVPSISRRTLIAAPFVVRELISKPRASTLRLAAVGADGMAFLTLDPIASHPKVKLQCVAEVDSAKLDKVKKKYPDAKIYQDWREMIAKEKRNVDIACVATPDHMHAPQGMSSMNAGWHVYQQKPLAHDLHEIRQLTATARKKKLLTQMGIQVQSRAEC